MPVEYQKSDGEALGRMTRSARWLSWFGNPLALAMTGFVILNLLSSYYSSQIIVPATGSFRDTFQIYRFNNGYTEANSDYYTAYTDHDPNGGLTPELSFPAPEPKGGRVRLDFLGDGTVAFPGKLTLITRMDLR